MSAVAPADSTVAYIRRKVRRLTSSPGESTLTTPDLDQYINNFYTNDFPYGIKMDQMRSIYTFYTDPYVDRYPLDVNYSQGVRGPMYVNGIQGTLSKDRQQFYNIWPKFPTMFQPGYGDGVTTPYNFTIPGPIISGTVTIGTTSTTGSAISISDDGNGVLYYRSANPITSVPAANSNPGIPGMLNANTGNPGLINSIEIGSINYVTGVTFIDFNLINQIPGAGQVITFWCTQYQPGRPYSLLFWNNEFVIRPIPKLVHKVEVEIYLTPVQFMLTSNNPILNQWAKYIAYGAAIDIMFDRQDLEGVASLTPMLDRQEALVLERQGTEEINTPNYTIFNSSVQNYGYGAGYGGWGGW